MRVGTDGASTVDGEHPAGASVEAGAFDLYLLLWNRRELDVQGDPAGLGHWRANARVQWG